MNNFNYTTTASFDRGFTGHEHLYNFGLINMNGRLLKSQISNLETVDVSKLNAGLYILKVNMADGREFTERIVKE